MSNTPFPLTIPHLFRQMRAASPDRVIQHSKNKMGQYQSHSLEDLWARVVDFAGGLATLGVAKGHAVGLISDNRREWLIADLAILGLGAADVPRGRDTLAPELVWILGKPRCAVVVAENREQAEKVLGIQSQLPNLRVVVQLDLDDGLATGAGSVTLLSMDDLMARGAAHAKAHQGFYDASIDTLGEEDLATIIFTSGTTGEPKGVMLSHRNFTSQLRVIDQVIDIKAGDIWLSVLPVWHSFERVIQYVALTTGSSLAYSKPIGKIMLQDMLAIRPMWMASVPRIWEAVRAGVYKNATEAGGAKAGIFLFFVAVGKAFAHFKAMFRGLLPQFRKRIRILDMALAFLPLVALAPLNALGNLLVFKKIKAKLGGRFRAGISGGGSLPADVDLFFAAAGITLLNGYGLTETAPVVAIRNFFKPVQLTLAPLPGVELRIVDDQDRDCPPNVRGLIKVRGGQVMRGYFENPEATARVLDKDGWLNTGDLGIWTHDGNFAIRGRAKDTIVLLGGENIEPVPIESKLRESEFIEQVMVVGQDQKYLGALVQIDTKAVENYIKGSGIPYIARASLKDMPEVHELINEEIATRINAKNGFRPFERIGRFAILEKPFEVGHELSAKQEIKRHFITELYAAEIARIFSKG